MDKESLNRHKKISDYIIESRNWLNRLLDEEPQNLCDTETLCKEGCLPIGIVPNDLTGVVALLQEAQKLFDEERKEYDMTEILSERKWLLED